MNRSVPENSESKGVQSMPDVIQNILVINCAVNFPLALISIIGNTLVLYGVWKTPSLRSPSIILLCGLALSDLTVGAVVQPLFVANDLILLYSESQRLKDVFLSVFNIFGYSLCGTSLVTVTAISIDRLIAIQKPLRYSNMVTIPRVRRTLVTIWTTCILLASSVLWGKTFALIAIGTVISVCLCVSTISHVIICKSVRHHQHAIQIQVQAVNANNGVVQNMSGLKRSAVNSFIVFVVLVICYCPYVVIYTVVDSSFNTVNKFLSRSLTSTVVFINSAFNPFLYCWRLREIREAVKQTCRKLVCCK